MTTICLKSKSSVKAETWSNVFSSFSTEAKSCLFMKQLTSTCVSTILYLRKVLSDDFFEAKSFEGMTLNLLKSRADDNYAFKIQQWLEGAFDAIEKKYLKRLILDIQDAESNKILEVYTMSFNYDIQKDSKSLLLTTHSNKDSGFSAADTKSNTIKLLQMCYAVTQTYGSLPSKLVLGMRLLYYENTPDEYEPCGYIPWVHSDPEFFKQAKNVEIGRTGTQHHFFKLFNKSCLSDKFFKGMAEQLENSSSSLMLESDNPAKKKCISQIGHTKAIKESCTRNSDKNLETQKRIPSKLDTEPVFMVSEKQASTVRKNHVARTKLLADFRNLQVRCSCLLSKKSESMFSCSNCGFLVHAECFGILEFDSSKKIRFYCHVCHREGNDYKCHDKVMIGLKNSSDQQKLSILRRVLGHCNLPHVKTITLCKMERLVGVGSHKNVTNIVLNKMIEIGVAIPRKRKSYLVDKNKLAGELVKYFYKVRNSDRTKQQAAPHVLRTSDSLKRKSATEELLNGGKKNKPSLALKEMNTPNNLTVSQQSFDIFC